MSKNENTVVGKIERLDHGSLYPTPEEINASIEVGVSNKDVKVNDKRSISKESNVEIMERTNKESEQRGKQADIVKATHLLDVASNGMAELGMGKELMIGTVMSPGHINPLAECISDDAIKQIRDIVDVELFKTFEEQLKLIGANR